ncbi:MAG: hypothetical protein IKZ87_08315 [Actinomycetaceae bacterium]|nr:hypothetical protein [Actinomycetaceae bacterium]
MDEKVELRIPSKGVYVGIVLGIVAVCLCAFVFSSLIAVWALSGMLLFYGFAQLVLPRGILPQVRSRIFDASICFLFAIGLAFFAQWANAAQLV